MKLKIYIIKKQQIIWAAIILAIVLIAAILLINLKTENTINIVNQTKSLKADIDNDGKMDNIIARVDDKTKEYAIDVVFGNGSSLPLEPDSSDPVLNTFGVYSEWWPMKIDAKDINNDKKSEIIIQSSDSKGPILYVFKYKNDKMEKMLSGRYSVFGVFNDSSDKSNIIVLGKKYNDAIKYTYLSSNADKLAALTAPSSLTLGKEVLSSFIGFIETKDLETFNDDIESKYTSKILKGNFLDSDISEIKYTKYDIPSECKYLVRTSTGSSEQKQAELYEVTMTLTKYDSKSPEYKISNVDTVKVK